MTALTPQDTAEYIAQSAQNAWTVPGLPSDIALRPIKTIGVIGAGTMGGGIAMNFATAGLSKLSRPLKRRWIAAYP